MGAAPDSDYKEPDDVQAVKQPDIMRGIRIDGEHFIANMVVIYDALFEIGVWQDAGHIAGRRAGTHLTNSPEDLAIINQIQPIIVLELIVSGASGMEEGDMKSAMLAIAEDGKPENAGSVSRQQKHKLLLSRLLDFVRFA
ncbi:hypothetical protein OK016_28700 [Vibrio chagasii]|nr:hypothetical protein [Vibrio chagasii]